VQTLQAGGATLARVCDGINDAAALAAADIGIAMAGGVQVRSPCTPVDAKWCAPVATAWESVRRMQAAGEVADVVLLRDCPTQVVEAFDVSRATLAKIRQNLAWAFGYNLVGVPVAAGALLPAFGIMLTPSLSGALMGVSSLAVMGNSLLLRREGTRPPAIAPPPRAAGPVATGA
jgi:P-type Cu+ transporter